MTEPLEAGGQDMKQEPPDELDGIEGHEPLTVAMSIVFPPKGHPPVLERQQAPIRDRYAMGIAREILGVPGAPTGKCTVRLLDGLSRSLARIIHESPTRPWDSLPKVL